MRQPSERGRARRVDPGPPSVDPDPRARSSPGPAFVARGIEAPRRVPSVGGLVGLQRSAGNRAVVALLGRPTVSRQAEHASTPRPAPSSRITVQAARDTRPAGVTAPAARLTPQAIAAMSGADRLVEAFGRARIDAAVRERILALVTPQALVAGVLSFVAAFALSQLTPVGWAADFALALSVVFVGTALIRAAQHLVAFADARNATTEEQLDQAGEEFARAVAEIGVDAVLLLITRALGPSAGAGRGGPPPTAGVVIATSGGRLAVVALDTVPVAIAGQAGVAGGSLVSAMSSGGGAGGDGNGGSRDDPPEQTAAERDWERAQEQADRQNEPAGQPKETEHGALRQQERGVLTAAEQARLTQQFVRYQPDGAAVRLLRGRGGLHTVVVTNPQGAEVTVIRDMTRAELINLSRNHHWNPPFD